MEDFTVLGYGKGFRGGVRRGLCELEWGIMGERVDNGEVKRPFDQIYKGK